MLAGIAVGTSGCIEDSDCGICDPDNLVLESISGINYASRKIHLLDPDCEGGDIGRADPLHRDRRLRPQAPAIEIAREQSRRQPGEQVEQPVQLRVGEEGQRRFSRNGGSTE